MAQALRYLPSSLIITANAGAPADLTKPPRGMRFSAPLQARYGIRCIAQNVSNNGPRPERSNINSPARPNMPFHRRTSHLRRLETPKRGDLHTAPLPLPVAMLLLLATFRIPQSSHLFHLVYEHRISRSWEGENSDTALL